MKSSKARYSIILAFFCVILSIIIISLGEVLISLDTKDKEALSRDSMLTAGTLIVQDIQQNIASGIYATETIHDMLKLDDYSTDNFEEWARLIVAGNKTVSNVQLAPNGIVSYIFPLENNEKAIGHDLLNDEGRDDGALKAVKSRELTFIGPVKLMQNGKFAVIARKPVFITVDNRDEFWGFTVALMLVEDLISADTFTNLPDDMFLSLEGDNPDTETNPVFISYGDPNNKNKTVLDISVPNGKWRLIMKNKAAANRYYSLVRILVIVFAVLISTYIFFQQYRNKSRELKIKSLNIKLTELSMKDELTSSGNRRAGMQILANQLSQSKRYSSSLSIIMLDIDHFKSVNDTYGHPAGDKLLQHLTESLKKSIRQSDSIYRLGGDEFLIILPNTDIEHCMSAAKKIQKKLAAAPCEWEGISIPVTVSIGIAEYRSGDTIDSLITQADKMLYEAKQDGRNSCKC